MMIQNGPQACFMKDKKGFLPAHVACSRHCSPEKLRMLLHIHPESMLAKTNDGQTLLSLAMGTATRSHPNYALIDALRCKMEEMGHDITTATTPTTRMCVSPSPPPKMALSSGGFRLSGRKRSRNKRKVTDDTTCATATNKTAASTMDEDNDPVNLLLHFSRHTDDRGLKVEQV